MLIDFLSNIYTFNALVRLDFSLLIDTVRHMIRRQSHSARSRWRSSLASPAPACSRCSATTTSGRPAKGLIERSVDPPAWRPQCPDPDRDRDRTPAGLLLSGAVLTETVFNLSGAGRTMYEAITGRDYVVIQGLTLVIAIIYVTVNLVVDILYGVLDPRVRLQ